MGVPSEPAAEVEDLCVCFGDLYAVENVSFKAYYGEVLAVLGPNGAGKTTTIETLEGYRDPTSGRVRVAGLDPVAQRRELAPLMGVVLQRGGVYPMMTARRVLDLFASYYDDAVPTSELLAELALQRVGATPYKRLSGGEQQRLALALGIVGRPKVLFLDEPTAGVDPAGRVAVRDVISRLRRDGVCVVLTSHELDEVERLADRIVMLSRGHLAAAGRPDELSGEAETIRFVTAPAIDTPRLSRVLAAQVHEASPGHYVIDARPAPATLSQLAEWLAAENLTLVGLDAGRERLEEVFLRLAAKDQ